MAFKKYADDYETVITTDENGNEKRTVIYKGSFFEFENDEKDIVQFKRISILLLIAITALQIIAGCVDNDGMYQFYVALPYVVGFFPLLYLITGALRLPTKKRKYRRDELGLSFDRMKSTSMVLMILLGIGWLGEIAFLVFGSVASQRLLEFEYLALETAAAAAVSFLIFSQRKIKVKSSSEE